MAQKERMLNPDGGPIERFAVDLREVRARAGKPSLKLMARHGNVAVSTLSGATSPDRLPTESVLRVYLRACGCDQEAIDGWLARRDAVAAEVCGTVCAGFGSEANDSEAARQVPAARIEADPSGGIAATPIGRPDAASGECIDPAGAGFITVRKRSVWLAAAAVIFLAGGLGAIMGHSVGVRAGDARGLEFVRPRNGGDPVLSGCTGDATISSAIRQPDGSLVELIWSTSCGANWGRITRYDNEVKGNVITVRLEPNFVDAPNPQVGTATSQQSMYTPLMLVGPTDKVCVTGTWTRGDEIIEVMQPACG